MATPLFVAMTRPAERWGLPYNFLIVGLSAVAVVFFVSNLAFGGVWGIVCALVSLPILGLLARLVTLYDPYIIDVYAIYLTQGLGTPNAHIWGGNSYAGE